MYRRFFALAMLALIMFVPQIARAQTGPHILVDADTGTILSQNEADRRWYPASLTKLMSAYVTFRAISEGRIAEGSPVIISAAASKQPPSKMGYKVGVRLRIDTALKIIIVKSANDVSQALAEAVSGNLPAFVKEMNREAKRLGMTNTNFTNAHGLHNTRQFSSARDMAVLSTQILKEFPQYAYMFEAAAIRTPAKTHYSYNLLLERLPGTTGMKTGFVCAAGYNMVASARIGGRNLIAVVLGRASQTDRAVSAAKLLSEAGSIQSGSSLFAARQPGKPPRNMRPVLCTQEARAARYDPGAGQAVIKSPFLQPRRQSSNILRVNVGGTDAPASPLATAASLGITGSIPVPTRRPKLPRSTTKAIIALGTPATGRLAIPQPRPR